MTNHGDDVAAVPIASTVLTHPGSAAGRRL
jgi:hypothetical protein